jgi:hypothetical protein
MVDFRVFIAALDKSAGVKAGGAGGGSGVTGVATEAEASGWNKVPELSQVKTLMPVVQVGVAKLIWWILSEKVIVGESREDSRASRKLAWLRQQGLLA